MIDTSVESAYFEFGEWFDHVKKADIEGDFM